MTPVESRRNSLAGQSTIKERDQNALKSLTSRKENSHIGVGFYLQTCLSVKPLVKILPFYCKDFNEVEN